MPNIQIARLQEALLAHPLGTLFTGQLYDGNSEPITKLNLPDMGNAGLTLDSAQIGRLFMAPDESIVSISTLREQTDGTPAGINVHSSNDFIQPGEKVVVVAYSDLNGNGVRIDALYLRRILLEHDAPERLCTIAFGLQACTAFLLGFSEITLFAAGRGLGAIELDKDDLVGYQVWPKFGFDADLEPADLNRYPHLAGCLSVQDVVSRDSDWWAANGHGIEMRFDLTPNSRSWLILLNYLYNVLPLELP